MITPYRPVYFKKAIKKFNYIIIHDMTCSFPHLNVAMNDDKKSATSDIRSYNFVFNKENDLPFHLICEKINNDYETILGRPFCYLCEFKDIPNQFLPSIHIGLIGNYSNVQPTTRNYQQIAYRALAPFVRWFKIHYSNIFLHREISTNKECNCPGNLFNKDKFLALSKPLVLVRQ